MPAANFLSCAVLTRPDDRNRSLASMLETRGVQVLQAPALNISRIPGAVGARQAPACYDMAVFVSGNAVRAYLQALDEMGLQEWPGTTIAAAVGAGTGQALRDSGRIPQSMILYPDPALGGQDSESLWSALADRLDALRRVLIVRGSSGREWLGQRLEAAGISVERLAVYQRSPAIWTQRERSALEAMFVSGKPCVFLLTSGEGVEAVHDNMRRLGLERQWAQARFVVIHERIAARLQSVLAASGKVEPPVVKICQPGDEPALQAILALASHTASS